MSSHSESSSEPKEKLCKGCGRLLPMTAYRIDRKTADKLRSKCKECLNQADRARSSRADSDDPPAKRPRLESATIPGEHLYVMAFSTDPEGLLNGFKVGRSGNIARRAHELANSMPHHMLVLATFPGQGHLEEHVHDSLAGSRNNHGRGREWFRSPRHTIVIAVGCSLQALGIVNGGSTGSAQQRLGSSWSSAPVAGGEEEGASPYEEGGGDLCEAEGFEADFSGSSAG